MIADIEYAFVNNMRGKPVCKSLTYDPSFQTDSDK